MFVVPLADDKITTKAGLPYRVISFNNYKEEGPAVEAEPLGGGAGETILFTDVQELNGQQVRFVKTHEAFKVFETDGAMDRKYQLPQPDDTIQSGDKEYKVVRLKLHVRNQLSRGLILESMERESEQHTDLVLGNVDGIKGVLFSRTKFLDYYADYREKGTA